MPRDPIPAIRGRLQRLVAEEFGVAGDSTPEERFAEKPAEESAIAASGRSDRTAGDAAAGRSGARPLLSDETVERLVSEIREARPGSRSGTVLDDAVGPYAPGDRIADRYELIELVGCGSYGCVFRALDTRLERIVAIKLPTDFHGDADQRERFLREARAAAKLRHDHIVRVYEVEVDAPGEGDQDESDGFGQIFIVTEFIEGRTLRQRLDDRKRAAISGATAADSRDARAPDAALPVSEAAALAETIARALDAAHREGVIHFDIKPANLLIGEDNRPALSDFGLARLAASASGALSTGQIGGTPDYIAPELASADSETVDRRADIYSLGVVLYEMLTGGKPFSGPPQVVLYHVANSEPPPPQGINPLIPADLQTIVLRCLEKDPRDRFDSAEALAEELRRFLTNQPIESRPPNWVDRTVKWFRRNARMAAFAALLGAIVVAASAAVLWQWLRAERAAESAVAQAAEAEEKRRLAEWLSQEAEAARRDAVAAREQAEASAIEAGQSRRVAEDRLDEAHHMIERYLARADTQLAALPEAGAARGELLDEIGSLLTGLADAADDPHTRDLQARQSVRSGQSALAMGQFDLAGRRFAAAERHLAAEVDRWPDPLPETLTEADRAAVVELISRLAEVTLLLGDAERHQRQTEAALDTYRTAEALLQRRDRLRPPDRLRGLLDRMGLAQRRATAHQSGGRIDDAIDERALVYELAEQAVAVDPAPFVRRRLVAARRDYAAAVTDSRSVADGVPLHRRAIEEARGLVRDTPTKGGPARTLVLCLHRAAVALMDAGRARESGPLIDEALHEIARYRSIANAPTVLEIEELGLLGVRIDVCNRLGEIGRSLALADRAVHLADGVYRRQPSNAAARSRVCQTFLKRAATHLHAGDYANGLRSARTAQAYVLQTLPDPAQRLAYVNLVEGMEDLSARPGGDVAASATDGLSEPETLDPLVVRTALTLTQVYRDLGLSRQGLELVRRSLEREPVSPPAAGPLGPTDLAAAMRYLSWTQRRGELLIDTGQANEAIAVLTECVEVAERYAASDRTNIRRQALPPQVRFQYARALASAGRTDEAIATLRTVLAAWDRFDTIDDAFPLHRMSRSNAARLLREIGGEGAFARPSLADLDDELRANLLGNWYATRSFQSLHAPAARVPGVSLPGK